MSYNFVQLILSRSSAIPLSVRLKPQLEKLLDATARRERKSRSAIIHEALAARLRPAKPLLGDAIRAALAETPGGFAIERKQPRKVDRRAWGR